MDKQEKIKELYFKEKYKQKEIAELLNVSNKYVSKVLIKDYRYKNEKEQRKNLAKAKHRNDTINYIKNKRKSNHIDVEYEKLKQLHIQASIELSEGRKTINNRVFRDWNKSAYKYNSKTKSYHLKKGITTGYDVPKKISWSNF